MSTRSQPSKPKAVALRKESVDRNLIDEIQLEFNSVALRKESVDRNTLSKNPMIGIDVALRKESVDRNYIIKITEIWGAASLSARRAWIEISKTVGRIYPH